MARNGSGTYTKPVADFANGSTANATDVNTLIDDIGDEITNSVAKDGQTVYTGEHDWNGNLMVIDTDGDSKAGSSADDQFDITLSSTLRHKFTVSGYEITAISNPTLIANDTDGVFTLSPNTGVLGGIIKLYGDTHSTKAGDIEFLDDTTVRGSYDASASTWDFNNIDGTVIGANTPANGTFDTLNATTLQIGGSSITSTAAELNILDGVTSNASELNILDGVTATAAELNYNDITTLGTQEASKALTADANNQVKFVGTIETVYAISDGASVDLDPANGGIQTWTLGAGRTPTESIGEGEILVLLVDDGSASEITWTSVSPTWLNNGGTAPTLATSGYTAIVLFKVGSTVYGILAGDQT